jgi:hypothetical protein
MGWGINIVHYKWDICCPECMDKRSAPFSNPELSRNVTCEIDAKP